VISIDLIGISGHIKLWMACKVVHHQIRITESRIMGEGKDRERARVVVFQDRAQDVLQAIREMVKKLWSKKKRLTTISEHVIVRRELTICILE
jgi:hypothetical protein